MDFILYEVTFSKVGTCHRQHALDSAVLIPSYASRVQHVQISEYLLIKTCMAIKSLHRFFYYHNKYLNSMKCREISMGPSIPTIQYNLCSLSGECLDRLKPKHGSCEECGSWRYQNIFQQLPVILRWSFGASACLMNCPDTDFTGRHVSRECKARNKDTCFFILFIFEKRIDANSTVSTKKEFKPKSPRKQHRRPKRNET